MLGRYVVSVVVLIDTVGEVSVDVILFGTVPTVVPVLLVIVASEVHGHSVVVSVELYEIVPFTVVSLKPVGVEVTMEVPLIMVEEVHGHSVVSVEL